VGVQKRKYDRSQEKVVGIPTLSGSAFNGLDHSVPKGAPRQRSVKVNPFITSKRTKFWLWYGRLSIMMMGYWIRYTLALIII